MISCIILAAGVGLRLRPITDDKPKCLVPLLGKPLLHYQIKILEEAKISPIAIVTGYLAEQIKELGHPTYHNPLYDRTNMVESLFAARNFMSEASGDLVISYGDIVYQKDNLAAVLNKEGDIVVMVDHGWYNLWALRNENPLNDAETLKIDHNGLITELGQKPISYNDINGQYTGLLKISSRKINDFIQFYDSLETTKSYGGRLFNQMYLTTFLQLLIDNKWHVKAASVKHGWLEVDTVEDLKLYEQLAKDQDLNVLWNRHV